MDLLSTNIYMDRDKTTNAEQKITLEKSLSRRFGYITSPSKESFNEE